MVCQMFKEWWKRHQVNAKRMGGMAEKEAATQKKLEIALKILQDQRVKTVPVEVERRHPVPIDLNPKTV